MSASDVSPPVEDVVIVGAGIVGLCTALSLLERGVKPLLIDPNDAGQQTSYGNAGVLSTWSCVPQSMPGMWKNVPKWLLDPEGPIALRWAYLPKFLPWAMQFFAAGQKSRVPAIADAMLALHKPTMDLYRKHLEGTGSENLVQDSYYLFTYKNAADANLDTYEWRLRSDRGAPLEKFTGGQVQELEPALSTDYQAVIAIKGQGRTTNPGKIGTVFAEKVTRAGGQFLRQHVRGLQTDENGCTRIATDGDDVLAKKVVLCAGPWSQELLKPLGYKLPLEAERGYHIMFKDPGVVLTHSVMATDTKFAASSMEGGLRCAGTAEFAGLDSPPNYKRAYMLKGVAKRLLPGLNVDDTEVWMGQRPSFPDTLPVIGPLETHPSIICAFGHGHQGLTAAPMTGELASMFACEATPNSDLSAFAASRFD